MAHEHSTPVSSTTIASTPSSFVSSQTIDEKIHSAAKALAEKISKASLTGADYIQSNSEADVLVIAELLGFGSYAEEYYFYGVHFTIDDDNNLVASLVLDSDYTGTFEQEWLTVTKPILMVNSTEQLRSK